MSIVRVQPRVVLVRGLNLACSNTLDLSQMVQKYSPLVSAGLSTNKKEIFQPLGQVRRDLEANSKRIDQQLSSHRFSSDVEAFKAKTLASIAAVPFMIDASAGIKEKLTEFQKAKTLSAARNVRLIETLEKSHQQLFTASLASACRQAAIEGGFTHVTTSTGRNGALRIIATDKSNRSLISEITNSDEPSLSTEVFGVADGSCDKIMKEFEVSLKRQGVHGNARRRFTGGINQLQATRDFVEGELMDEKTEGASTGCKTYQEQTRRSQRLNIRRQKNRR